MDFPCVQEKKDQAVYKSSSSSPNSPTEPTQEPTQDSLHDTDGPAGLQDKLCAQQDTDHSPRTVTSYTVHRRQSDENVTTRNRRPATPPPPGPIGLQDKLCAQESNHRPRAATNYIVHRTKSSKTVTTRDRRPATPPPLHGLTPIPAPSITPWHRRVLTPVATNEKGE